MLRHIVRWGIVSGLLLFAGVAQAKTSPDYRAGYNDGCSSSRGHYTRSAYKYRHSSTYHSGWRKGKHSCTRHRTSKRKVRRRYQYRAKKCNTEAPWVAFQHGWDDGYRSAKGKYRYSDRGCASYRHGWVSGYRSCHCAAQRRPDSYVEGYHDGCASRAGGEEIKEEGYYQTSPRYHKGWMQGYEDCQSI